MPSANDLRKGQVIKFNNEPHLVMETQHRTPGNLRAFVQAKLRNLRNGRSLDQRFNSTETMEVLNTDRRTLEFSYADRENFAFMDPQSYETVELSAAMIGEAKYYLVANGKVEVLFVDDRPVTVDLPSAATLKVTDAPEGDLLGQWSNDSTWPGLQNPYIPKGVTPKSYKMKSDDLVVDK